MNTRYNYRNRYINNSFQKTNAATMKIDNKDNVFYQSRLT
jgi:hypothetical protein